MRPRGGAFVPALPGCGTQAETEGELRDMVKDTIECWLSVDEKERENNMSVKSVGTLLACEEERIRALSNCLVGILVACETGSGGWGDFVEVVDYTFLTGDVYDFHGSLSEDGIAQVRKAIAHLRKAVKVSL